ncbi:MAG: Crp/Fnr family transcriptional regulator [Treponemataceae bacterium]|nr:Crp/Fnr family transcriptional regulator [Treponemataceae bacterium]
MLQLSFINYKKGSYILVEGKPNSDRFFIVQVGKVRCSKVMNVVEDPGTLLGPGDFVGVIPCMSGHSQIETAVAVTDVVMIAVRRDQYTELIEKNTPVALKIIRTFAERMRILNETLTKLTLKSSIVASPEMLVKIASYYEKIGQINLASYGYYQYMKECPTGMNIETAKKRFVALRGMSKAVYYEPNKDAIRVYPKDTMIFSECQSGSDMFIIQSGQVKITKFVDDNEVILAVLKKGDFFGEMALLENKPRSASAIAYEDCKLMVVNKQNFNQMVQTQSQMIFRLTTTLADRLWAMNRQLENTAIPDPVNKLLDMLALQLEKGKIQVAKGEGHQFDLTPTDLANMCGIPKEIQYNIIQTFLQNSRVKLINEKIFIKDSSELIDFAIYVRNQSNKDKH